MLDDAQLREYHDAGFLVVPDVLTPRDLAGLRDEVERLYRADHPGRVLEKDGTTIRGVHGCHQVSEVFSRLVRLPALLMPAEQLLASKVYVHQSKVNAKRALAGDVWPWHQDYIFWEREDGMPAPLVTNVALLLDDATPYNGPLLFLPGSHHMGTLPTERRGAAGGEESWKSNLAADLDYALTAGQLASMVARFGMRAATGSAGSMVLFDPRLVHGSGTNMSPYDRQLLIITYNSVDNVPDEPSRRPEFLSASDTTPLAPLVGGLWS
ncbi:phytanoyl-CoA dioxygenase family protein [Sphaerisporangium rubeum]|uniref:Ectoine hydroxylase n=1 Tax=Sphaerisporangium rubeum TaxID=321317 RepID=A0A7X0M4B6_9ACTN|nr:ectoine hydroxylase [Sphaerisporangium rubeum]